jgi:hypothetical protein
MLKLEIEEIKSKVRCYGFGSARLGAEQYQDFVDLGSHGPCAFSVPDRIHRKSPRIYQV